MSVNQLDYSILTPFYLFILWKCVYLFRCQDNVLQNCDFCGNNKTLIQLVILHMLAVQSPGPAALTQPGVGGPLSR